MFLPVATSSVSDKGIKGNYKKKTHTNLFPIDYRKASGSDFVKNFTLNNWIWQKLLIEKKDAPWVRWPIVVYMVSEISSCLNAAILKSPPGSDAFNMLFTSFHQ